MVLYINVVQGVSINYWQLWVTVLMIARARATSY